MSKKGLEATSERPSRFEDKLVGRFVMSSVSFMPATSSEFGEAYSSYDKELDETANACSRAAGVSEYRVLRVKAVDERRK